MDFMDFDEFQKWATDYFICSPKPVTLAEKNLVLAGYLYAKFEKKNQWNEYQLEWRKKNPDKTKLHIKNHLAKPGIKEKKRAYAKEFYHRKKQQQKQEHEN